MKIRQIVGLLSRVDLNSLDNEPIVQFSFTFEGDGFSVTDLVERDFEDFSRTRMTWPDLDDLRIAVMAHKSGDTASRFDHLMPGLDHLGFECASPEEVETWAAKLDDLGYLRGPVEDVQYAVCVTTRTPDGIPIEFFFPK